MAQSSRFPGETAEQIAKRAEIAFDKAIKLTNEAEASSGTTMICVIECRKMLGKAWTPSWVNTHMKRIGWDHAGNLLTLYKKSPEDQKAWFDKQSEANREYQEASGQRAPRDNSREWSRTLALPDIVLSEKEKARIRQARKRAKDREARVEAGADIPAEPLAPIEQRRLLNELKSALVTLNMAQLRKVEAFLHEEFFAPDVATAA